MRSLISTFSIFLSLCFFIIGCQGSGSSGQKQNTLGSALNFLPASVVKSLALANAPPYALGSSGDRQELQQLLTLQSSRTKAECQRAGTEVNITLNGFFGPAYGPLTAKQVESWSSLFKKVYNDVNVVTDYAKDYFDRPRPFIENPEIEPCIQAPSTPSFPSSHAATAETFSHVLADLLPNLDQQIIARTNEIATDRSMAGVHRPSEVEAGLRLGDLIYQEIEKNPEFQAALGTIR